MTEPDLGPLFRSSTVPSGKLDADAIIKRSRRRRLPRLVITTAIPIIAVVGLLGGGVYGLAQLGGSSGSEASSAGTAKVDAPASGVAPSTAPFNRAQLGATCGEPVPAEVVPSDGLVATSTFPNPRSATAPAETTLTNTSSKFISGIAGEPSVIVEGGGVVVAMTTISDDVGRTVRLGAGSSMKLDVSLPGDWCLNAVLTGNYKVYTLVELTLDDGEHLLVGGPATRLKIDR